MNRAFFGQRAALLVFCFLASVSNGSDRITAWAADLPIDSSLVSEMGDTLARVYPTVKSWHCHARLNNAVLKNHDVFVMVSDDAYTSFAGEFAPDAVALAVHKRRNGGIYLFRGDASRLFSQMLHREPPIRTVEQAIEVGRLYVRVVALSKYAGGFIFFFADELASFVSYDDYIMSGHARHEVRPGDPWFDTHLREIFQMRVGLDIFMHGPERRKKRLFWFEAKLNDSQVEIAFLTMGLEFFERFGDNFETEEEGAVGIERVGQAAIYLWRIWIDRGDETNVSSSDIRIWAPHDY